MLELSSCGTRIRALTAAPLTKPVAGTSLTAPQIIQTTNLDANASVNFPAPPTLGSMIVVFAWTWAGNANTFTDNAGNTYTEVLTHTNLSSHGLSIFTAPVVATTFPFTVTGVSSGFLETVAMEAYGVSTLDKTSCADDNSVQNTYVIPATPISDSENELVVGLVVGAGNPNTTWGYDSANWTELATENDNSAHQAGQAIYRVVTSKGGFAHTWTTLTGGEFAGCVATFK